VKVSMYVMLFWRTY